MNFITEPPQPTTNDYNSVLNKLQDYMFTENKIHKIQQTLQMNCSVIKSRERAVPVAKKQIFEPREKDSLFWCFFIMKNGMTAYEMTEHRNFIVEKKIKIEYVEKLRKEKALIKPYKLATLAHIESKLANDDKIDVQTLLVLCVLENLNVVFIKKRMYYELQMNSGDDDIHVIHSLDTYKYKFGHEISSKSQIDSLKLTLFQIDNFEKPFKSVSSYKLSDLVEICNKLNIDTVNKETNKQKNKNDLYESIVQHI
jgi:hypothetical protein